MIHHHPGTRATSSTRGLAQAMIADEVLEAAWFTTNLPGRGDLSPAGFRERQLLKGRGAYLGERMVLAVTARELIALRPWGLLIGRSELAKWARADLVVRFTTSRNHPDGIPAAIEIVSRRWRRLLADVEPLTDRVAALAVIDLLGRPGTTRLLN